MDNASACKESASRSPTPRLRKIHGASIWSLSRSLSAKRSAYPARNRHRWGEFHPDTESGFDVFIIGTGRDCIQRVKPLTSLAAGSWKPASGRPAPKPGYKHQDDSRDGFVLAARLKVVTSIVPIAPVTERCWKFGNCFRRAMRHDHREALAAAPMGYRMAAVDGTTQPGGASSRHARKSVDAIYRWSATASRSGPVPGRAPPQSASVPVRVKVINDVSEMAGRPTADPEL